MTTPGVYGEEEMSSVSEYPAEGKKDWKYWMVIAVKVIVALAVIAGLIAFLLLAPWPDWLGWFLDGVQDVDPWGEVLLCEVYIACTILFIPGSILTLGAGFAFGVWKGVITVSIGSTIGATAAFLYGNTLLRDWVENKISGTRIFGGIDRAITNRGWLIVFLLRLSPVVPFNLLNYALGLTNVGVLQYMAASWAGMLPATIVYVWIGSAVTEVAQIVSGGTEKSTGAIILFWVGLAATIVALILLTWFAKREITKAINMSTDDEEAPNGVSRHDTYGGVVNSVEYDVRDKLVEKDFE